MINATLQTSGTFHSLHLQWTVPTVIPDLAPCIGSIYLFRDDVHTHFATLIVKWTIVGGWVKPLDDKRGKVGTIKYLGTIKSSKNLGYKNL